MAKAKKPAADPLQELDAAAVEHAALQSQRQHEREIAELRSKLARSEQKRKLGERELSEAYEQMAFVDSLGKPTAAQFSEPDRKPSGDATAVYILGDWHVEEDVDPEVINGLNRFNLDICAKRIQAVAERACELTEAQRGMSKISDGVVSLIGDMITGHIHEDLSESNWLSPVEATLFAQDQIVSVIDHLKKHSGCKTFTVVTNFGNHGRITRKPRSATAASQSYEWLMYKQLERYYRNDPRVKWKVERGRLNYLDIQGKKVRFTHGDQIKYYGGSGGLMIPTNKAIDGWNATDPADYTFFGHFHWHEKHPTWTLCNCLIGFNAYALDIKARATPPSQTLAVFDKKRKAPVLVQEIYCDYPGWEADLKGAA